MLEIEVSYNKYPEDESSDNLLVLKKEYSSDNPLVVKKDYPQEYPLQIKPKKQFNSSNDASSVQSRDFACMFCERKFAQKLHMDSHFLNKHKEIPDVECLVSSKIHYCKYCDYRTINSHNLASHTLSKHKKGSKQYLHCFHCKYTTHNKGNLIVHSRRHANVKLFHCQYCELSYNQKCNLDTHYLRKHRNQTELEILITSKLYECKLCEFKTLSKTKYVRHIGNCCKIGICIGKVAQ